MGFSYLEWQAIQSNTWLMAACSIIVIWVWCIKPWMPSQSSSPWSQSWLWWWCYVSACSLAIIIFVTIIAFFIVNFFLLTRIPWLAIVRFLLLWYVCSHSTFSFVLWADCKSHGFCTWTNCLQACCQPQFSIFFCMVCMYVPATSSTLYFAPFFWTCIFTYSSFFFILKFSNTRCFVSQNQW
jgi:hypothetical protein